MVFGISHGRPNCSCNGLVRIKCGVAAGCCIVQIQLRHQLSCTSWSMQPLQCLAWRTKSPGGHCVKKSLSLKYVDGRTIVHTSQRRGLNGALLGTSVLCPSAAGCLGCQSLLFAFAFLVFTIILLPVGTSPSLSTQEVNKGKPREHHMKRVQQTSVTTVSHTSPNTVPSVISHTRH